ncbi:hypothetical protein [Fretibacter rubidus]|uniref:lipoyl protein ligase domain-containing protein n=1 Tax=Fretibacter rubidus TaxID=570162 RepID=UPI00352A97AE
MIDPTLKSVTAPPRGDIYDPLSLASDWKDHPRDGIALREAYSWEEARLSVMRSAAFDDPSCGPLVYGWIPATSISLSKREAAKLGVREDFTLKGFTAEPLAIRGTGGTAVPQGPGTMNITFFTRHKAHPGVHETYNAMCQALQTGFNALSITTEIGAKPGSFCDGDYNLLYKGRKLVGTAQRWCRARNGDTIGVHHAVVLTGGDPMELCVRLSKLYNIAGHPTVYDPSAHSDKRIDPDTLRDALSAPLAAFITQ